jgi:DNA replication protein DnaC
MAKKPQRRSPTTTTRPTTQPDPKQRLLDDLKTLKISPVSQTLDEVLIQAEQQGWSYVEFAHRMLADFANQRRERSTARRIKEARFRDICLLSDFDWNFNSPAWNRVQIEELATGAFVGRHANLVMVGQSGLGKSFLIQAIGRCACVHCRVRYITSADLLRDLTAALADHTLPKRLRYYAGQELLIIDEFGFDLIERTENPQAASLLYKIIDARHGQRATALVTNIDFDAWGKYLGDPPLAMAFLDRLVDGATILKTQGKSYRAHRASQTKPV